MTLIVATLTDPHAEVMARASAETDADVVEVRIDLLRDATVEDISRLHKALARPAMATVRRPRDGGRFEGGEDARRALLEAAVDAGYSYVDVEADAGFAGDLIARARAKGRLVVLSWHDLAGTPPVPEILRFLRDARARGAWCGKLAATLREPRDAVALVDAAATARAEGLRFAIMATNDAALRALAPALGCALAYGSAGAPAAPGQVPAPVLRRTHARIPPTAAATTRLAVVLGDPVAHSRSPAMQNAGFRAAGLDVAFLAWRVTPLDLGHAVAALRAPAFLGANVTLPHKVAVLSHLDALAPSAEAVGAVNVVAREGGRLVGHNTDGVGALRALAEAGVEVRGVHVLVLGAGGAARAVAHALAGAGAVVTLANRTPGKAQTIAEDFGAASVAWAAREDAARASDVVVNCTSLGLHPGETPLAASALRAGQGILDACYRAGGTDLLGAARARGCRVVPGEAMLLHQGAAAFELWTGVPAPLEAMRGGLRVALEGAP